MVESSNSRAVVWSIHRMAQGYNGGGGIVEWSNDGMVKSSSHRIVEWSNGSMVESSKRQVVELSNCGMVESSNGRKVE